MLALQNRHHAGRDLDVPFLKHYMLDASHDSLCHAGEMQ